MINKHAISVHETAALLQLITAYPLATVITSLDGSIEISQLPVVADQASQGKVVIRGHMSTRNPQWQHLKSGAKMVLVFNGPNTYINSSWYKVNDVSTWNYISVQAEGTPIVDQSYDGLVDILRATTDLANRLYKDQWDFNIPNDLKSPEDLIKAIGGFTLEPAKLFGKFKLSQSKSLEDQKQIIEELYRRGDENSRLIARYMADNLM